MNIRILLGAALLLTVGVLPLAHGETAPDRQSNPLAAQAAGVATWISGDAAEAATHTGHALFDKEWTFGAWQMAALGFAQQAASSPTAKTEALARFDACIERIYSPAGRAFDSREWGEDVTDALDSPRGHVAWLGYTNLALSSRRAMDPDGRWAEENDVLSAAILVRLEHDLLPETYPGERYPVDVSAMVASVGLWAKATGRQEPEVLDRWRTALKERWLVDGVLVQAIRPDGTARDGGRGSGSFLASWFLSRWDPTLASALYHSASGRLRVNVGPLLAMREYPPGVEGPEDIDSGPIVGGLGVSSTGFAIGAARAAGDVASARALERTATLFGQPETQDGVLHWKSGAALGSPALADAIMFAMISTPER
jgi:hypothetical protein